MFLTRTSEIATGALLYLAMRPAGYLVNPGEIAAELDVAPAYTAKVLRTLAKAGMIRSRRGATGGFELVRSPNDLTLLEVVDLCQGDIVGHFCVQDDRIVPQACAYHQAMQDLQAVTRQALGRWTLAKMLVTPPADDNAVCRMRKIFKVKKDK
jgi:Rrf2 family protein